jgi:hypothetical protein
MKRVIFFISALMITVYVQGQYVTDAFTYSLNFPSVTARSMSMGNAFTSLGAISLQHFLILQDLASTAAQNL